MHRRILTSWECVESLLVETFLGQNKIQGRPQLQLQQQIQLQLQLELTYTYNCHYSYNCNSRGSFIFNYSCKYLRLGLAWLVSSLHRPQTRYDLVPRAATMGCTRILLMRKPEDQLQAHPTQVLRRMIRALKRTYECLTRTKNRVLTKAVRTQTSSNQRG